MQLLRSWPAVIPPAGAHGPVRAHVVDGIERLVMSDFDYRVLADVDDDVLLIEWDLAVSREDLEVMIDRCRQDPDRVRVAPYRLYMSQSGRPHPQGSLWAHRRYQGDPQTGTSRFVLEGEPTCHLFGLGLTYLPRWVIPAMRRDWDDYINDTNISAWHYRHAPDPEVPIDWDVRPVHLHYHLPEMT